MLLYLLACLGLYAYLAVAVSPQVELSYGSFVGTPLTSGTTQWLGIPFAAPPLGSLRFAPPVDPPQQSGLLQANKQGPLCIATGSGTIAAGQSEDCLYLAVYAPSSATPSSNLPVFVFIQGGGFNSNSNPNLNGTGLIQASGQDIIVVTFNYRVGPWGFLAGTASSSSQPSANNGLRDQAKAFEWIQKYISAFGGNPKHVVLGGDSAGAASIALHLTAHGGRDDGLFHAAAAESVSFATVLTPAESQYQYDNLARQAGCTQTSAAESLSCLRSLPAAELQQHNMNIPYPGQSKPPLYMFNPTLDNDFVTDLTYVAFATGKFIHVPVIIGDDTNGGTVFTPRNTSSQEDSNLFLTSQFPYLTQDQLNEVATLFPVPEGAACDAHSCWWRQLSNAYGEMRYMCPSLYLSSAYANISSWHHSKRDTDRSLPFIGGGSLLRTRGTPPSSVAEVRSYAYRYDVLDPAQYAAGLGVPHTVELNAIFGPDNVQAGAAPASYFPGQSNAKVVPVIQAYWTSFIKHFDPNVERAAGAAVWNQYGKGNPGARLLFGTGGTTSMENIDSGLQGRCEYLWSIGPSIKQKRDGTLS